jgi:hypothetical protein
VKNLGEANNGPITTVISATQSIDQPLECVSLVDQKIYRPRMEFPSNRDALSFASTHLERRRSPLQPRNYCGVRFDNAEPPLSLTVIDLASESHRLDAPNSGADNHWFGVKAEEGDIADFTESNDRSRVGNEWHPIAYRERERVRYARISS